jgi:hypothetical protein
MMTLQVGELITDPDFTQMISVKRSSNGKWENGRFEASSTNIKMPAVVTSAKDRDLKMIPNGDMITGAITIRTNDPLYTTHLEGNKGAGFSDEIVYHGENWKVVSVQNMSEYGYFRSVAVRKRGA